MRLYFRKLRAWNFSAIAALAALTLGVVGSTTSHAAIITEAFDTAGALPLRWGVTRYVGTGVDPSVMQISPMGRYALRFARLKDEPTANSGFVYYNEGTTAEKKVADLTASVTLQLGYGGNAGSSNTGFMLRASNTNYSGNNGYYIAYTMGTVGSLAIYKNPASHVDLGTPVSAAVTLTLQTGVDYVFKVSAIGSVIEGSIWAVGGTSALATVMIDDATTTGGYFGLRTGFGNTGVSIYFNDLQIETIPEPGAAALALSALVVGIALFRRGFKTS